MSKQERLQQSILRCRKNKQAERWKQAKHLIIRELAESLGGCSGATFSFVKCAVGRFKEGLSRDELIEIAEVL